MTISIPKRVFSFHPIVYTLSFLILFSSNTFSIAPKSCFQSLFTLLYYNPNPTKESIENCFPEVRANVAEEIKKISEKIVTNREEAIDLAKKLIREKAKLFDALFKHNIDTLFPNFVALNWPFIFSNCHTYKSHSDALTLLMQEEEKMPLSEIPFLPLLIRASLFSRSYYEGDIESSKKHFESLYELAFRLAQILNFEEFKTVEDIKKMPVTLRRDKQKYMHKSPDKKNLSLSFYLVVFHIGIFKPVVAGDKNIVKILERLNPDGFELPATTYVENVENYLDNNVVSSS